MNRKNIRTINKKREIYYEYLELSNLDYKYHLIHVDSDNYSFIIPSTYQINYSQSNNNYESKGHIYFFNNKYTYSIDYKKKEYEKFKEDIGKYNITKEFKNYRGQEFIEVSKSNIDYIYTYYQGYYYKIYSDHRLSINEYYDMYLILFSITKYKLSKSIDQLKELYYLNDRGIYCLCNDIDLLTYDLKEFDTDIDLKLSDILIYNDYEFLKYKSTKSKVEEISASILSNMSNKLRVKNEKNNWYIDGIFNFSILGNFCYGYITNYDEIIDSDELSMDDKTSILNKIIKEKQYEVSGYNIKIKQEFYNYLINYFDRNLTYELWENHHIREFINFDYLPNYEDNLNDFSLYKLFMSNLYNNKILSDKLISDSIKCEQIIIYPDKYELTISGLNNLFDSIKIIFNEEFDLIMK